MSPAVCRLYPRVCSVLPAVSLSAVLSAGSTLQALSAVNMELPPGERVPGGSVYLSVCRSLLCIVP